MSAQHQGVGMGGELKVIYGLKMSKTSTFYVYKGRSLCMHIVCMNSGYSQVGVASFHWEGRMPPPAPPLIETLILCMQIK